MSTGVRPPSSVVCTGAAGFLGRRVLAALAADGTHVHAVVRPGGRGLLEQPGVTVHPMDVADPALGDLLGELRPDGVINLAVARADGSAEARAEALRTNVTATGLLLEAAAAAGAGRFVQIGGALEYAPTDGAMGETVPVEPQGYYGATKAAASLLVTQRGTLGDLHTVVLRPFLVYGPGQSPQRLIPTVLRAARDGVPVPLTGPGPARDWIYVDDVAAACRSALVAEGIASGSVINVGSGEQWTNFEVVEHARAVTGRSIAVQEGAVRDRPWDRPSWRADTTRLRRKLGVIPRGLRTGLADTWAALAR